MERKPAPSPASQSHDAFFRESFSNVETVKGYIEHCLPPQIGAAMRLETLKQENTSFLDRRLRKHFSDVIWRCELKNGKKLTVSILFDHKSEYDELAVFQLLRYVMLIWDSEIRHKKRPMPILPIVVYHC